MRNHNVNEPSQRQLRVGEQIRHIIAETLRRGHFHHEALMNADHISVTEVRISPDLKNATAYVISLGGFQMDTIIPALNEVHAMFQKEIARQANLRFTPRIRFVMDDSFDHAQRIEEILRDLPKGQ
jgi:ribosome-binding factor A